MNNNSPFLRLEQDCRDAVDWIIRRFDNAGLLVMRTFDLQVARQANIDCPCPHHGTEHCDCQMVVLLVYKNGHQPISVVAHGYDSQTRFSIVDSPQQRADPGLEACIRQAVVPQEFASSNLPTTAHVS